MTASAIPVYATRFSPSVEKYIELDHFCSIFQELYNDGWIERVYYQGKRIEAIDTDGDIVTDII